jgi:hypothetical protein
MQVLQDPNIPMAQKIQVYQALNKGQDLDSEYKRAQIAKIGKELNAPAPKTDKEKQYEMYQNMPDGPAKEAFGRMINAEKATGKDDRPGEDERKVSYHVGSIMQGLKNIQKQVASDTSATSPGMLEATASAVTGEYGGAANVARSAPRQIIHSTTAGVLDSLLYLATGAAYNKEQLDAKRAELTPAYTDKPETVAYKRQRIAEYIQAAKERTGRAWTPEMTEGFNQLFGVGGQSDSRASQVPGQAPTIEEWVRDPATGKLRRK